MSLIKLISEIKDHINFDVSLQELLDLMIENHSKHFVLLKDKKPVGIITERDILSLYTKHIDLNLKAIDFANKNLISTKSSRKTDYVLGLMLNHKIRRIIVIDKDENYLGSILQEKLIYEFEQDIFKTNIKAKDLIKNNIKAQIIQKNSLIQDALEIMDKKHIGSILVFDNTTPIGILTESDVVNLAQKHIDTNMNIALFSHKNLITFDSEDSLFDIVKSMKEENIRRAVIFDKTKKDYYIITSKEILDNVKGNYNLFLESKLKDVKNTFNSLNEAVIELFDNDEEQIIYWFNNKAKKLFDIKIDKNITSIIPATKWELIYEKIKNNSFSENEIIEIGENVFQITIIYTKVLENSIIKLLFTNISEITNTNKLIEKKLQLSDIVFENTTEGIIITNEKGEIISVNNAFSNITGYFFEEIKYLNPKILKSGKHDREFYTNLWAELEKNGSWKGEIWNRKKNGEVYPEWLNLSVVKDSNGKVLNYVALFSDITKIKNSNAKIEYLAHHDPLTNLPNRLLLKARLNKSIEKCNDLQQRLAIFFIDIDNFKMINDTYGHSIGDKIINLVAQRLQKNIRKNDTISRIGGDEFIIVVEDIIEQKNIQKIAQKILNDFLEPIKLGEYLFDTTISMGISIYPNNGLNAEDLIKHADTAMYSAKNAGRNQFQFYKKEMTSEIFEKIVMKQEINDAIKNNEFEVYYQPQIDIKTNKIIGAEALLRWNHKSLGLISPDDFIPHAEETKLIIPLGNFVLKTACSFMKKLHQENLLMDGKIAVNISAIQLKHTDIYNTVIENLKATNLDARFLELELTETFIMENVEESIVILNSLKEIGVQLSIDDFGTGYSSLSYLKQFPIDKLKIDKSFIAEIPHSQKDIAITKTVIALAKGLGIKVIAEGVEKEEQKEFLTLENCDEIQGWFYAKALKEEDFIKFVKNLK